MKGRFTLSHNTERDLKHLLLTRFLETADNASVFRESHLQTVSIPILDAGAQCQPIRPVRILEIRPPVFKLIQPKGFCLVGDHEAYPWSGYGRYVESLQSRDVKLKE